MIFIGHWSLAIRRWSIVILVLLVTTTGWIQAQTDDNGIWQPEVRRAEPIIPRPTTPAPEIRSALPVETPLPIAEVSPTPPEVRRAIPILSAPAGTPPEIRRALLVDPQPIPTATPAEPEATPTPEESPVEGVPYRPEGRIHVAPAPTGDEEGDIRLSPATQSPQDAAAAQLALANSIYARKTYDYALTEYEKFLISYPQASDRDIALFRLAECHRMLGNENAARDGYERLLGEFRKGEFAGAGAYRLGEYLMGEGKFEPALTQFQLAAAEATNSEVQLSALYNLARCHTRLEQTQEAEKAFRQVAAVKTDNPYRNYALLAVAESDTTAGRKKEALQGFLALTEASLPDSVRAEAAVKAAALAVELGQKEKALELFDLTLGLKKSDEWKSVAFLGSMRLQYDLGHYDKVATMAEHPPKSLPDEAAAEMLLLSANSYRQTGNTRAARAVYDRLLIQYPHAAPSQDARFQRLVSMYQLGDPKLLAETERFLKESTNPKERAQVHLLRAESLFKDKKYAEAGPIYGELLSADLSDDLKTKALFKLGWCQSQTGDASGAVKTFTEYITNNPKSPTLASALIQRGLALQQEGDYTAALKDFDRLIADPKAAERELALQQKALILGQKKEYPAMITTFEQLLKEYPKSSAAGQASFWIGWAAFENKDYQGALASLEQARKLDPDQYTERATLRIILAQYYLQDREALVATITKYPQVNVPTEITRWLGRQSFDEGDYAAAEKFLLPVAKDPKSADPEALIALAEAQIRLGKNADAAPVVARYLEVARDPSSRARGLQAQAAIALAGREFDKATALSEESLLLQPEGRLNAEGRLLIGEIAFVHGNYPDAARAFMTVAVLYDDPSLTPRALRRAADAYRKADNLFEADKALKELQKRFPDPKKSAKAD